QTVETIGPSRFSGVCSDSTGNTRLSRQIACTRIIKTALNFGDCCHHLNRTIWSITALPHFQETVRIVRKTITTFHTSHIGHAALEAARSRMIKGPGLEAIGKTRFATIILSALSVQRNLAAIKNVIESSPGSYPEIEDFYQTAPGDLQTFEFERSLSQLCQVGTPAAKALACLEAVEATAADVYVFWHAVLRATEDVLQMKKLHFERDVADAIRGILNARHRQLFEDGNIATDGYLTATYLNPS
ncbi:hypothetical protein BV25DRAFT_1785013, partial [Artomyces pyxidatus]